MNTELIEIAGLSVELVRKPIKNLHIGVYPPAGRIRVAAPSAISEDALRLAVLTRLDWIKRKRREFEGQVRQAERKYISGETHYVFGRAFRLMVRPALEGRSEILPMPSDRLKMTVPMGSNTAEKALLLSAWYRRELRDKATPRIQKWAELVGVPIPRLGIKLMRTKWGSCNPKKGIIWINLDLAKKPITALDYVVLHELAHFVSQKHDDIFIGILDRHMPSWRQVRAELNALPLSA